MTIRQLKTEASQVYISVSQGLAVAIPTFILIWFFDRTAPLSISKYEFTSFWSNSWFLRPLIYFLANLTTFIALALSVMYGMQMQIHEANIWLTGQILNLIFDIIVLPMVKIAITSSILFMFCPKYRKTYSTVFRWEPDQALKESTPEMKLRNIVRLPQEIRDSPDSRVARLTGKQQQEMYISAWKLIMTLVVVVSFNQIVNSIIPQEK